MWTLKLSTSLSWNSQVFSSKDSKSYYKAIFAIASDAGAWDLIKSRDSYHSTMKRGALQEVIHLVGRLNWFCLDSIGAKILPLLFDEFLYILLSLLLLVPNTDFILLSKCDPMECMTKYTAQSLEINVRKFRTHSLACEKENVAKWNIMRNKMRSHCSACHPCLSVLLWRSWVWKKNPTKITGRQIRFTNPFYRQL